MQSSYQTWLVFCCFLLNAKWAIWRKAFHTFWHSGEWWVTTLHMKPPITGVTEQHFILQTITDRLKLKQMAIYLHRRNTNNYTCTHEHLQHFSPELDRNCTFYIRCIAIVTPWHLQSNWLKTSDKMDGLWEERHKLFSVSSLHFMKSYFIKLFHYFISYYKREKYSHAFQ